MQPNLSKTSTRVFDGYRARGNAADSVNPAVYAAKLASTAPPCCPGGCSPPGPRGSRDLQRSVTARTTLLAHRNSSDQRPIRVEPRKRPYPRTAQTVCFTTEVRAPPSPLALTSGSARNDRRETAESEDTSFTARFREPPDLSSGHWSLQQPLRKHEHTHGPTDLAPARPAGAGRNQQRWIQRASEGSRNCLQKVDNDGKPACTLRRTRPAPHCRHPFVVGGHRSLEKRLFQPTKTGRDTQPHERLSAAPNLGTLSHENVL